MIVISSEGLVHPGTFKTQANGSSRQTLVSENKVNPDDDDDDDDDVRADRPSFQKTRSKLETKMMTTEEKSHKWNAQTIFFWKV